MGISSFEFLMIVSVAASIITMAVVGAYPSMWVMNKILGFLTRNY